MKPIAGSKRHRGILLSGYFQALLSLACALPVSSARPLFTDVTQAAGIAFVNESGGADKQYIIGTQSAGGGFWDYDSDGDLDILVANLDDTPVLLRNDAEGKGHWLLLTLRQGATEAIGAQVLVQAGGRHQMRKVLTGSSFQAQRDMRLHFGLGPATAGDIEITWPGGERQVFQAVPADRHYVIHRGVDRLILE